MSTPDRNATAARPKAVRSIRAWGARRIARVALLLGLAAASTGGAQPDGEDPARLFETTPEQFVVANAQFVLMHELAHLVIDEKRVPILGPEESAADYIAAMMLIRPRTVPPEGPDALLQVAVSTAEGFALAWRRRERIGAELPYWDNHSLTVQRFSTLACLLYGSNPERFSILVERLDMPEARARSCVKEYERAAHAIDWLFDTYARKPTDPPGAPIEIRFEEPPTLTSVRMRDAIERQGFIERTFRFFNEVVALDEPATFVMRSCRLPQAMWLPETRELVLCYELLDAYMAMGLERSQARERGPAGSAD
ncbi:MAG TPA: DUF4344 domain-containing metallopeptidase [Gammaproteobacteria bacterium]